MPEPDDPVVQLPEASAARLASAVYGALTGGRVLATRLDAGAQELVLVDAVDVTATRRFRTLLELGYLVASADGFDDTELRSLSQLLARVTVAAIDRDVLELHFRELDEAVATHGRQAQLVVAAAQLAAAGAAEETIELVATIAMADGHLSVAECAVLVELGRLVGVSPARVRDLALHAARTIEDGLR